MRFPAMVVLLSVVGSVAGAMPPAALGHWEGALSFRGAEMPIRIELAVDGDELAAKLDIPSLVMAWEPIPVTSSAAGVEIELPFGLGPLAVTVTDGTARGEKSLGEDALTLRLKRAAAPAFESHDVRFRSGEIELVGRLVVPPGEGPHPAVVLLHGSVPQGRDSWTYRSWADFFVRHGLAVLYYDKRGFGESGGDEAAGFRKLAGDGAAAVRFLRTRPEVDPSRIGLRGASQGAWIAQMVAGDLGDVAFLNLSSAAGGTPREQELQKIEYRMRGAEMPESAIEDALAYAGLYFYVVRTGEGWPLLEAAARRAENADWGAFVDQPLTETDLAWWRENHAFQPAELVSELDLPVLLLYGGADPVVPPVENAEKLRGLFPHPEKIEVHVFPDADHRLELDPGRDAHGQWQWPRLAPAMRQSIAAWLESHELN
ncbi:MAG: hypothetical protein GY716_16795 [bacterium]|nr:hypothetical protein [bacterium]